MVSAGDTDVTDGQTTDTPYTEKCAAIDLHEIDGTAKCDSA